MVLAGPRKALNSSRILKGSSEGLGYRRNVDIHGSGKLIQRTVPFLPNLLLPVVG